MFATPPCNRTHLRILMNLHMGAIDDLKLIGVPCFGTQFEHASEHSSVCPSEVKTINSVSFAVYCRQLIPLRSCDQYPPDATQSFEKISRLAASFFKWRIQYAKE